MAITAFIFAFLSPSSIKTALLAEIAALKVEMVASQMLILGLRSDVDAFNRDTFKKLGDKYNALEIEVRSIDSKCDQTEIARKNFGNRWAQVLGRLKKEAEISDEESDSQPATIEIPENIIQPDVFDANKMPGTKKGFASLIGK